MRIKLLVGSHYYFEQKRELLTITVNKVITVIIIIMRKLLTPKNHDLQNTCIKFISFLLYYKIFSESC